MKYAINYLKVNCLLKNFTGKYKNNKIIILSQPGIGDVCIGLAYAQEYTKKTGKAVYVCCEKVRTVVEDYGFDDFITVSTEEMEEIRTGFYKNPVIRYQLLTKYKEKILIIDPGYYFNIDLCRIPGFRLMDVYKYGVYKVKSSETGPEYPLPYLNYDVKKKFGISGKYVILNEFSNSASISSSFFESSVNFFISKGYDVYSNVFGDQKQVKGTKPLRCTIQELYYIARECSLMISVRSGILDYIINSLSDLFVIYESIKDRYLFSLDAWQCNVRLKEVVYTSEDEARNQLIEFIADKGDCE